MFIEHVRVSTESLFYDDHKHTWQVLLPKYGGVFPQAYQFFVTAFGTGIAGYTHEDMINIVSEVMDDLDYTTFRGQEIIWPPEWDALYEYENPLIAPERKTVVYGGLEYRRRTEGDFLDLYPIEYRGALDTYCHEWYTIKNSDGPTVEFIENVIIPLFSKD
jgi:hypothetical protein